MREGNQAYNRAQVSVSTRADLDNVWAPEYVVPCATAEAVDIYGWDWMQQTRNPELLERLKRISSR